MFSRKLNDKLSIIDLKPVGIEKFIASYVLKGANKTAIIETGPTCSIPNLLAGLKEIGIRNEDVDFVAVSHIHIDHAGGAGTLLKNLPNAKLLVHARGAPHMINPEKLWEASKQVLGEVAIAYEKIEPVPETRIISPADGTIIDLGGTVQFKVIETLGHASHHLGFVENIDNGIFQGDAAGIYVSHLHATIPTTPAPFHLEMTISSIQKMVSMEPRWLYYTHFGPADDAVNQLEAYVRQLKLWERTVQDALREGDDLHFLYKKILEKDPQMKTAAEFIQNHFALRQGVVMQNIEGFVEYLKKKPTV